MARFVEVKLACNLAPFAINVDDVSTVESFTKTECRVMLRSGLRLSVEAPYADLMRALRGDEVVRECGAEKPSAYALTRETSLKATLEKAGKTS
mgnify:FL=1